MGIQHQTVSPRICECVYEEKWDDTVDPPVLTLWFFHNICERHLPLVVNKPQLGPVALKLARAAIVNRQRALLDANRIRHLAQFDALPEIIQKLATIDELKKEIETTPLALKMEAYLQVARNRQERFLDNHEDRSMERILQGVYYRYAFISQEVYDAIQLEISQQV